MSKALPPPPPGTDVSRKTHRRDSAPGKGPPDQKMSTLVLLSRYGLQEYYTFFEKSGMKMMDGKRTTDAQVEQLLTGVESHCGVEFLPEIRVKLWKALRYQWFRGPGHTVPFIERDHVPELFLPKRDYKQVDDMIKFSELEPDRQRQITRKTRPCESTGRGPGIQTLQFENYRREDDMWYEFRDLQRCVAEWERMNPRTMIREDPREEVMKMRTQNIIAQGTDHLLARKAASRKQQRLAYGLLVIQILSGFLSFLMFFTAYSRYQDSPSALMFGFITGSQQFVAAVAYLMAFAFSTVVANRRHTDPMIRKLGKMLISCERLIGQISDFRVETEDNRMMKSEQALSGGDTFKAHVAPKPPKMRKQKKKDRELSDGARHRPKKPKVNQDGYALWAPDAAKNPAGEDLKVMKKQIAESFKRLEPMPEGFRRQGGDRMVAFEHRLGGVDDNEVCVHITAGKHSNPLALEMEKPLPNLPVLGPAPGSQLLPGLGESAALPSLPAEPIRKSSLRGSRSQSRTSKRSSGSGNGSESESGAMSLRAATAAAADPNVRRASRDSKGSKDTRSSRGSKPS